jgi:acetylglutamate kinase
LKELIVIKIGGNIIDDEKELNRFLLDFSKIKKDKILVHGGGKSATELSRQLNIETKQIDGRRITDKKTLDVVTMVYAGLINKNIVAKLQANHCNALGLTGADANFIIANKRKHATIDFGFVGDIEKINPEILFDLLLKNITPVIAPLTHDGNGNLLNTNADTIASEIAIESSKSRKLTFIYCFEKNGLLNNPEDNNSVIHSVKLHEIEQLKEKQIITGGMVPKIDNIINALNNGKSYTLQCQYAEFCIK